MKYFYNRYILFIILFTLSGCASALDPRVSIGYKEPIVSPPDANAPGNGKIFFLHSTPYASAFRNTAISINGRYIDTITHGESLVTETELGINQIKIDISYPTVPSMKNSLFVSLDASPDQDYYFVFVLGNYGGISGQLIDSNPNTMEQIIQTNQSYWNSL